MLNRQLATASFRYLLQHIFDGANEEDVDDLVNLDAETPHETYFDDSSHRFLIKYEDTPPGFQKVDSCDIGYLCVGTYEDPEKGCDAVEFYMGLGWLVAYVVYVRTSRKHQKYIGVPPPILILNIVWEIFWGLGFLWAPDDLAISDIVTCAVGVWVDFIQLYYWVKFEWSNAPLPNMVMVICLVSILPIFLMEFHDHYGFFSAYIMNYLMSLMFLFDLYGHNVSPPVSQHDNYLWELIVAGFGRWTGTAAEMVFYAYRVATNKFQFSPFLVYLWVGIFALDVLYMALATRRYFVVRQNKEKTEHELHPIVTTNTPSYQFVGNDEAKEIS